MQAGEITDRKFCLLCRLKGMSSYAKKIPGSFARDLKYKS
jgi:hypothetical protein